jgi:hypothetical protein
MSSSLKKRTAEMYDELGAFVEKGVSHKVWGFPLTLPYFHPVKRHTMVVDCVDAKVRLVVWCGYL